ncbi:MAG: FAD:protein FMN transferase [Ruminococcaceae bacterium]|nr:FAD:protein FMN transferase [Oscillospiraceae bacterium]
MKKLRFIALALAVMTFIPLFSSCAKKEPYTKTYYEYFDTVSTVYSYAKEKQKDFDANCAYVSSELQSYHRLFDIYREYSGINNLKTVNDNAGKSPVKVDRKLIDFILYAKQMYDLTGGEMNIAMGSVLSLWHHKREEATVAPDDASLPLSEELMSAAKHISFDKIIIDEKESTVFISDKEQRLDPGALGKGYATERIAAELEARGVSSYVLDIGGNLRIIGAKPDGNGWRVGITDPKNKEDGYSLCLNLSDTSCVTSGDYERYYTVEGKNFHHIIDKDTLYPADYFASVTIVCKDSALADALSTALFCMPYEDGLALVSRLNADAVWIFGSGEIKMTDGIKNRLSE